MTEEQQPSPSTNDINRYRNFRQEEIDAANLYLAMASAEPRTEIAELYLRLAASEDRHAEFWANQLERGDIELSLIHL